MPPKKRTIPGPSEYKICELMMQEVRLNYYRYPCLQLFHKVSNEGKRHPSVAESQGILAGVSDYCQPTPDGSYCGMYIEIKAGGKEPSPDQYQWLHLVKQIGHRSEWSDNLDDALKIVFDYAKEVTKYWRRIGFKLER